MFDENSTEDDIEDQEIQKLLFLLIYALENPDNIHRILAVLSKALSTKHILLSWVPFSGKEATEAWSKIQAKIYSETEDGGFVLSISENKEDWSSHSQLAFSVATYHG